ncbi:MAG: cytochrome-c oxidase, cbb3-type subunit III, partial [Rhodospirillales bacterium]|nr:cytochrome-c oxidase, cbb3-type subunit III [Rhodospirillales bacterium]
MAGNVERDAVSGTETTGHEWDGIKELNTPLPRWWIYTFYATIVWAVAWCVFYPWFPGMTGILGHTERKDVAATLSRAADVQKPYLDRIRGASLDDIRKDPQLLSVARTGGRIAFNINCAPCHQSGGAGIKGYPNLADDEWLWGGSMAEIEHTIRFGIRSDHDKGRQSQMPRFGLDGALTPAQIDDVVEHVLSLSKAQHDPAKAARGAKVYAEQCVACHLEGGKGNREVGAPAL